MCPLEGQAKMSNLITEQMSKYSLDVPQNPIAIMVWVIWLAVIIMVTIRNRDRDLKIDRRTLVWLAEPERPPIHPIIWHPVGIRYVGERIS